MAAWIIFTAFSLGGGLAQSMKQLITFRALQGVGGSGLYSLSNVGMGIGLFDVSSPLQITDFRTVIPQITPKKHFGVRIIILTIRIFTEAYSHVDYDCCYRHCFRDLIGTRSSFR